MTNEKIKTLEEAVILSEIASSAGALMLANGAEIYRVEDLSLIHISEPTRRLMASRMPSSA